MKKLQFLLLGLLMAVAGVASAEPTDIVVRAKARDAKFIGTSIGGAMVRIRAADTGELLAEGLTRGSTGSTDKIMRQPHRRFESIAEGAASFTATLDISEPVFITIEVAAPYIKKQARVLSQTQTWLIPGKPIDGDGITVEVPGLIVDLLSPQTHRYTSLDEAPFEIRANVVMMCGCPITPGGLWNGETLEVAAMVQKDGTPFGTIPMKMDGDNTFTASLQTDGAGVYQLLVYAYDPKTGNTGVDQVSFIVR
ncbi:hypothetical protein [Microbulbifer sp. TYP-18]|uniref:hypothetical protein n=1 Tax=Microbulbifer sp. TYP-18 TaxID=3230024 RepID=UPI0034C69063